MIPLRASSLAAVLGLAALGTSQSVLLRYKPPVGKTMSYVYAMKMTQNVPGMASGMGFSQTVPMTMRVLSRKGNLTTTQTKLGKAKVTVPAGSPMASAKPQMEAASSNKTSTTVIDDLGNLKRVEGMGSGMGLGSQNVSFPKKAVKVGDTWTSTVDMGKMMPAGGSASGKIPVVYKLVSLKGGVATLAMTMNGTTNVKAGAQAMTMRMMSKGTLAIDAATGMMRSMNMNVNTNMKLGATGQAMTMSMVMSMKSR